jgi:hypothetical protein
VAALAVFGVVILSLSVQRSTSNWNKRRAARPSDTVGQAQPDRLEQPGL